MSKVNKLTLNSPGYPELLKQIPDPPEQLFVAGNLDPLLNMPRIALVGSRRITHYGRQVTEQIASDLAKRGLVIISGLALGVDSVAQRAAIQAGGKVIAVLPTSLDKIAPSSNIGLAREIIQSGGALVSEYSPETPVLKHHFIARNRIVSGLSDGLLVTEAAQASGTFHTVRFALEQGKSVMAVPGNITSQMSQGANSIIKEGAGLVVSYKDVLFNLGLDTGTEAELGQMVEDREQARLLELIASGITDGSELLKQSRLSIQAYSRALTMLELNGLVRPLGADNWGKT